MTPERFGEFLRELRDRAGARLGGSFATGLEDQKPGFVSDVDLVVLPGEDFDDYGDPIPRPLDAAIAVFDRYGIPWGSVIVGSINSPRDLTTLPRPVEVSETTWIKPNPAALESRALYGVTFVCHREEWSA